MDAGTGRVDRAREARLQDMKPKEKVRPKEKEKAKARDFDRVLEQSRRQPMKPAAKTTMQQVTEQAARETKRREEHDADRRRRDEGERERGKDSKSREEQQDGKVSKQRVVAKGRPKERRGGGSWGGQGGFGAGSKRRGLSLTLKRPGGRAGQISLAGKFEKQLRASLRRHADAPRITQVILNQLVQYVRIGLNRKKEREIQIDLHERIFKGLKLKVISRGGKVGVHFLAADSKTRHIFEKNRDGIRDALAKSGIEVDEIVVS